MSWSCIGRCLVLVGAMWVAALSARAQTVTEINQMGQRVNELFVAGRYREAIPIARRLVRVMEEREGADGLNTAIALNSLALLLEDANRLTEAESIYRRVIRILEKSGGRKQPNYSTSLGNLSALLYKQRRYPEAEALLRRAIAIDEARLGPNHTDIAIRLNNLALLLQSTFRRDQAEQIMRRALAIDERAVGPDHPTVAKRLGNLAQILVDDYKWTEAEPLIRRALTIEEKRLGGNHSTVSIRLNSLALLLQDTGRTAEAVPLMRRALAIEEKNRGANHPEVANLLANLALLVEKDDAGEAERLKLRALAIEEASFGPSHPRLRRHLSNLGWHYGKRARWSEALAYFRRSNKILEDQGHALEQHQHDVSRQLLTDSRMDLRLHVFALQETSSGGFSDEAFHIAQLAMRDGTAEALSLTAARFASGRDEVASAARELQDLTNQRRTLDAQLISSLAKANRAETARIHTAIGKLDASFKSLSDAMARKFPRYVELANPRPLTVADVQALLKPDEVLVQFMMVYPLDGLPDAAFAWAVSANEAQWRRLDIGAKGVADHVEALRCGLDLASWLGNGLERCNRLLGTSRRDYADVSSSPLPFDLHRAHTLYRALFGGFEEMLRNKSLLMVPSGALASLPPQVLVTEAPTVLDGQAPNYARAAWLASRQPVTLLPSIASLSSLRKISKSSAGGQAFIGFGNPLLMGPKNDNRSAWSIRTCAETPIASNAQVRSARPALTIRSVSLQADRHAILAQNPLPETATELCSVSRTLGAPESSIYLGDRAREGIVKALSLSGALAQAKIIHFATHGVLSSESERLGAAGEPGLILTPPDEANDADDGLLTASEVAQLKLDADWVVLSACNTAAGGSGIEQFSKLSGLARAFFYAGARALLVSHWAIDSDAAVKLTTRAFAALREKPQIGRAEAFRQSLIAMISDTTRPKGWPPAAHPSVWGPFMLVGEGRN